MKITFSVNNQILTRTDSGRVIANSSDYLEVEVDFSTDWQYCDKTIQFRNGDTVYTYVLVNDKITQDKHLVLTVGTWKVSIFGVYGNQRITTNTANVQVSASGYIGVTGPTQDVYEELVTIMNSLHTEAASEAVVRSAVEEFITDNFINLVLGYVYENVYNKDEVDAMIPTDTSDLTNGAGFITDAVDTLTNYYLKTETYSADEIDEIVSTIISTVYRAAGSKSCAELLPSLLYEQNVGCVYNMTDSGVTTEYFVEGAGLTIHAGDNVAIVVTAPNVYMFDLLTGFVDLSNYYTKSEADTLLGGKVDKVAGYGLSKNDFTDAKDTKLTGISTNATKTEASTTNGNIKIDGVQTQVYDDSAKADKEALWTDATATGNPVTIKTQTAQAAKSTELSMLPVQDLHGYSKPWVGGAGKNLIPYPYIDASGTVSANITYTTDSQGRISASGIASGQTTFKLATISNMENTDYTFSADVATNSVNVQIWDETTSSSVYATRQVQSYTFTADSTHTYTIRLNRSVNDLNVSFSGLGVMLEKGSTAHDYEPYANICPITGRTGAEIITQGINLWDEVTELGIINQSTGQNQNANNQIRSKNYTAIQPNTKYCFLCKGARISQIFWYDKNNAYLSYTQNTTDSAFVTTSPANAYYARFQFPMAYGTTYQNDGGVNYPSSYTDYSAHTEQTVTRSYGQTVYGGSDTVETGELSVEWAYIASYNGETITEPWVSDRDEYIPNTTPSTGAEVAYKLASPTTTTLTAAQVNLIKGLNNISTDADGISLTYLNDAESLADADNRITSVLGDLAKVEGATASQNYAVGDYLVFQDKFCKASGAITSGDSLAIGTNLTQTTVGAELLTIIAQLA